MGIRCVEAGKNLKHAGQGLKGLRTTAVYAITYNHPPHRLRELLKLQKQKLQAAAVAAAQSQQAGAGQAAGQVQPVQPVQAGPQLASVATSRPGTVLTGATVANLQVARLVRGTGMGRSPPACCHYTGECSLSVLVLALR